MLDLDCNGMHFQNGKEKIKPSAPKGKHTHTHTPHTHHTNTHPHPHTPTNGDVLFFCVPKKLCVCVCVETHFG